MESREWSFEPQKCIKYQQKICKFADGLFLLAVSIVNKAEHMILYLKNY